MLEKVMDANSPVTSNAVEACPPPWWTHSRFGMFIHWGVYSVPAGQYRGRTIAGASEWLMLSAKVHVAEYKKYAAEFNPVRYDPDAWVRAAAEAGIGYLVITAKHHDGFAMFPSKATDWNVVDATPWGKDLLGPLVEACQRHGVRIGFYYSQAQDWSNGGAFFGEPWDPSQTRDIDGYLDRVAIPQIRELLTLYGPDVPAVLWWDTPAEMTPARAERIQAAVEALRPGMFQNDRLSLQPSGHFETPEQRIPTRRPEKAWETCMTTNDSWGFSAADENWKSPTLLISQLCEVVSQGGNYLLNVGPKADGTIPEQTLEALRVMGVWMKTNGQAIRGASAGPFPYRLDWGFATRSGDTVYLLIDRWPSSGSINVPLLDVPVSAGLLARPEVELRVEAGDGGFDLKLPGEAPDAAVSVVALRFAREPRLGKMPERPRPPILPQPADGSMSLRAQDAEIFGEHLALMLGPDPQLGCWSSLESYPLWRVSLHRSGNYVVEMEYAVPAHRRGTLAHICLGEQHLPFVCEGTGGWGEFRRVRVGTVRLEAKAELHVKVMPVNIPVGAVMNMRALHLTPTE